MTSEDCEQSTSVERLLLMLAYAFPPQNITGAARPYRFFRYAPGARLLPLAVTAVPQPEGVSADISKGPAVAYVPDRVLEASGGSGRNLYGQIERLLRKLVLPGEEGVVWAYHAARFTSSVLRKNPDAVVYSTSPPLAAHFTALQIKKRFPQVTWVADFRDPLVGNPFRYGRGRLAEWADVKIEQAIFKNADVLIANTDTACAMWKKRYPQHQHKMYVIWNGFDPAQPLAAQPLPDRPYKVLNHTGTLYGGRHPGALLDSLERLITSGRLDAASVRVELAGPVLEGSIRNPDVLERLIARNVVEYKPTSIPKAEAKRMMQQADGLLLLDLNDFGTDLQVPAKLFEYLQIGRPVLAFTPRDSPSSRILADSGIGHCCIAPADQAEHTDAEVLRFFRMPSDPQPLRDSVRAQFDAARQTEMLARLIGEAQSTLRQSG